MKIIFIEDDYITIEPIVEHLEIEKHQVEVVSGAQEAVDRIESQDYDVIFCDIMFAPNGYFTKEETADGRYTGLRLLEHIRRREKEFNKHQTKVFLITNWRNEPRVDSVAETNNANVIRKPLSISAIEEAIHECE